MTAVGTSFSVIRPRLSLYLSVTGGNDWSVYYVVMTHLGSFYPAVFLSYTFFFIFAACLHPEIRQKVLTSGQKVE